MFEATLGPERADPFVGCGNAGWHEQDGAGYLSGIIETEMGAWVTGRSSN